MKVYLLTGATGIVGSAVLARLLRNPDVRVLALVRASSDAAAATRLDSALASFGSAERTYTCADRLCALAGDATQPGFGLAASRYDTLARSCTHIIHSAGAVRMNLPLATARLAAVGTAQVVLDLARVLADTGRLAKVEFVSTVGVAGREHRHLSEDWIGASHQFHNTYEQAKAEAERLVDEAARAGLPVSVHRPSMVVGDSSTGHASRYQVFYFLVEFLAGRRTFGVFPRLGSARLDIVPIDFVAEAIVRSSESSTTIKRILHLCSGPKESVPLRDLRANIHEFLIARGESAPAAIYLPRAVFGAGMKCLRPLVGKKTRSALGTLPILLDYLGTEQTFENSHTLQWLREEGITLPRPGDYLPRILQCYFASNANI